ncbi:hypothetical protein BBJ28_00022433 [Nothophytophthora sp. Chile5]|nr:hypothetical protein BBJ28_00022433 [Nothophytophthora sp. Chile5]
MALPSANLVLAALRTVHSLCQQVRDRPRACLQAHARLHQAFLRITSAAKHGSLPAHFRLSHYTVVLAQLRAVIEQHLRLRNLLARVMASRRLLSGLARVHHDLNALLVDGALASATSSLLEWKQQFASNRQQDEKSLHDTLMALLSTPTFMNKEFPSERRQALVLLELVAEFAVTDPPRGHSPQLLETLKMTHRRISNQCDLHLRRVPRWFLPGCEVEFSFTEHAIGRSRGSFGSTLQRGEAYRYSYSSDGGLTSNVTSTIAVKCLWALPDVHYQLVDQLFARTGVSKWTRVHHPNVVPVRGASHAANPPYIVRDFTTYGGLTAYLAALEARANAFAGPDSSGKMEALTWQLLYGASRGLLHLHEQHGIVHGGLRCNNLLVDKKGRAVIADFGLYTLACDARDSGLTEFFQLDVFDADAEELIRWQAPECLREHVAYRESLTSLAAADSTMASSSASASATSFATDVYAFGMCILEALTRTVPWAGLEISEIRSLKENLGLLPPRPKRLSSHAWSLIEKMCAADPCKRLSLAEASQELKRLGYGDRGSSRSRNSSSKDLEAMEREASTKLARVSSSLGNVSQELKQLSSWSRNNSTADLAAVEQEATEKLVRVSSLLSLASEELKRLGYDNKISRNNTANDLVAMGQEAAVKLMRASSDGALSCRGSSHSTRSTSSTAASIEEAKLAVLGEESNGLVSGGEILAADKPQTAATDNQSPGTSEKEPLKNPPVVPVEGEEPEVQPVEVECKREKVSVEVESAPSEASTVKQTGRRVRRHDLTPTPQVTIPRGDAKVSGGTTGGSLWDSVSAPHPDVSGMGNIWKLPDGETKANALQSNLQQIVRSMHDVEASDATGESDAGPDNNASARPGNEARSTDTEQPEQEMEDDTACGKMALREEVKVPGQPPSDGEEECGTAGPEEEITDDRSAKEEEEFIGRPSSVPTEFQTARSFDEVEALDERESSDDSKDPVSPTHPVVALIEDLKAGQYDDAQLVSALKTLKDELELAAAWLIVARDGLLVLMELVWREYSDDSTVLSLEVLQAIAALSPEFVTALVDSKVVKVLLAVVKHRSSPKQVDLAASFLLDVIANSDTAKEQLWEFDGIAMMQESLVLNRRLVQEFKSTMAKFKRSEGYRCLNDGEYHLAIDKFSDAIALDRKRAGYYGDRSLAYMEASMFKKAADDANRCMRYNPYDATGYLRHGLALKALGKYNEAIVTLRKGRQVDPKFAKIRDVLADVEALQKGGDAAPARRRVTAMEAAKLKKKDGDDALRKKEYALAIECYSEALQLDPKNDWVYLHRSIAYAGSGENAKAIEDASHCIRINYRQIEGYYRLALALHAAGQRDQALSTLYRGQEVDPRHTGIARFISQLEEKEASAAGLTLPEWFKEKGYRAFQLRSYEDAIKFYTKALDVSQSDDDEVTMHCYLYRSRANQTRGEFAAVIADCSHVLAHRPTNVFARLRRADAYEQQRDFHMALKDIRELVVLNPEYEDAHARLRSLEHRCRLLPSTPLQNRTVEVDL